MKIRNIKLTVVSTLHYIRLVYRSALFIALIILYIKHIVYGGEDIEQYLDTMYKRRHIEKKLSPEEYRRYRRYIYRDDICHIVDEGTR